MFGLPERNHDFTLKDTDDTHAYRLYNLDAFDQEVDSDLALYGSIGLLHSIHADGSFMDSFLLNNISETWIDLQTISEDNKVLYKQSTFISESGILDFYIFGDTNISRNFFKTTLITGFSILPALFSLGYHQSRWGYQNQKTLEDVNRRMDEHSIPYDVLWVDIDVMLKC